METRRRGRGFILGLLADLQRKNNCWTIAEHAGEADPHGMQYLLAAAPALRRFHESKDKIIGIASPGALGRPDRG